MLNNAIRFIADRLVEYCEKTNRVHHIVGDEGETVYLIRYIVLKSKFLTIFIHRFMRSDGSDPHDHPWNFFTYVISGSYREQCYDRSKPRVLDDKFVEYWSKTENTRLPGSLAYRRALDIHRVEVDRVYQLEEIERAPYTICFIGPRLREWGFWIDDTLFIDWREYLEIRETSDERIEGSK